MKIILSVIALTFLACRTAIAGTATLTGTGNWNDSTRWSSTPAGFAPNNGNNGENWSATVSSNTVTVDATTGIQALTFSGGTIQGAQTLTVNAASSWNSGNFLTAGGITDFAAGLSLQANSQSIDARTVKLTGGTSTWSSTNSSVTLFVTNSGAFRNETGSVLTITNNTSGSAMTFNGNGAAGTVSNAGTLNKNGAGNLAFSSGAIFNNTGIVNVNNGILAYGSSGGSASGTIAIGASGLFRVTGGSYTMNAGVQLNGAGILDTTGGTVTFNGTSTGSTGNLRIFGGTLSFASGADFTTTGSFTGTSGTLNGTGTVRFGGLSTWSGGNLNSAGATFFDGGVTITASGQNLNARTLNIAGTSSIGAGNLDFLSTPTLANSGTFNLTNATALNFNDGGAGGTLSNSGTINKSAAGTATVAVTFSNTSILNVTGGTLAMSGGVTQHSGTALTAGTWNVTGGALINITTGSNITTNQATVTLDGAGSSFAKLTTALNDNQGSFTLKNNRDLTTAGAYSNSGSTSVQDSTTVLTVGSSGGAAYTQTAGNTILAGGAMIDASAFNLNGGTLKGTGIVDAPLTTTGSTIISPGESAGALTINGNTSFASGNLFAVEIGGLLQGTQYDYLDVNGTLALAGLLDVDFINAFENSVQLTDVFTVATADAPITGAFSNVASGSLVTTNSAFAFEVWYGADSPYGANNVVLTHAPEPGSTILLLGGVGLLAARYRQSVRQHVRK